MGEMFLYTGKTFNNLQFCFVSRFVLTLFISMFRDVKQNIYETKHKRGFRAHPAERLLNASFI